jgi:hypothetical protein
MDKRKNNGGNSTKAKGVDKRKNDFKKAIEDAFTHEDVIQVLRTMRDEAVIEKDIQAAKVFLDYAVGKPKQQVDVTTDGEKLNISPIQWVATDEDKQ